MAKIILVTPLSIWDLQPFLTTYSRLTGHGFILGAIWTHLPPKAACVTKGSAHTGEPPGPAGPGVRAGLARLYCLEVSRSLRFQQGGSVGANVWGLEMRLSRSSLFDASPWPAVGCRGTASFITDSWLTVNVDPRAKEFWCHHQPLYCNS